MKSSTLRNLGIIDKQGLKIAQSCVREAAAVGLAKRELRALVEAVIGAPEDHRDDAFFGPLAMYLADPQNPAGPEAAFVPREAPAPWKLWGEDLDPNAIEQMRNACELPVAVRGALMPDAHVGYGLPIGGVLAARNAVIPYAVGVDIACRMKMSVLDLPASAVRGQHQKLTKAIEEETSFGIGASFKDRREHEVLDADWSVSPITYRNKDKAWAQLGSSGSGNHFVEFGELTVIADDLDLPPGEYLSLLSHSGSRGTGASVCAHYSKLAQATHPNLPKHLKHLAWLDLDTEEGQEYWNAMNLMGEYASANHACIHRHVAKSIGAKTLWGVENHHNFAWKEEHDGEELIVHRKGATPASAGELGVIPGSMATPTFIVRGRGSQESLRSSSHGAGRLMSRKKARQNFTWSQARKLLAERGVTVLSAGLDEAPMVYKDIDAVMAAQEDLVEVVATFMPRIVKMAPDGERAED